MKTIAEMKTETRLAFVVADRRGLITEVNDRFTAVFGWTREEIVGKRLETIIPPKLRDAHRLGFSRFLRTGRPVILGPPLELRALAKDGREFAARHVITAEQVNGNWMFAATIQPLEA
jgi:PAS domain S-box-containing protein